MEKELLILESIGFLHDYFVFFVFPFAKDKQKEHPKMKSERHF